MTPRERVLAAINHKEPDMVPIDIGATQCSSLTLTANDNLKRFLKIERETEVITCPLTESILPLEEILLLFEADCRMVSMKAPKSGGKAFAKYKIERTPEGHEFTDDLGTIWKKCQHDYAPIHYPFSDLTKADLDSYPWPDPYDSARVENLREEIKALRENCDYALVADIMIGGPFEQACRSRGTEQFFVDLASDEDFAVAFLEKLTDLAMGMWDAQLSAIGDLVDVVCQGDDLGMQTGLQISPDMYRRIVKPFHKKLFSFIKSKTKAKLWLHSCGSVYTILPDLIEVGVDILNPVQTSAKYMDLPRLKKEFGKEVVFWGGGIDIQKLPGMDERQIDEHVKYVIDIMAPGGGYVFAATHNILPETSGEKIHASYMSAVKNRSRRYL